MKHLNPTDCGLSWSRFQIQFYNVNVFDLIVIAISSVSVFYDLTFRKIPNWLIGLGLASGMTMGALDGWLPFVSSAAGFIVGIAVLMLPFAMGWIGAGDVKFFGVVGCLLGTSLLPRVFLYSSLVAGVIAVAYLISGKTRFFSFKQFWLDVRIALVSFGRVVPSPVRDKISQKDESVPWGVAFAVGMLIAYYIDPKGQWAGF